MKKKVAGVCIALCFALLAACGGGVTEENPEATTVEESPLAETAKPTGPQESTEQERVAATESPTATAEATDIDASWQEWELDGYLVKIQAPAEWTKREDMGVQYLQNGESAFMLRNVFFDAEAAEPEAMAETMRNSLEIYDYVEIYDLRVEEIEGYPSVVCDYATTDDGMYFRYYTLLRPEEQQALVLQYQGKGEEIFAKNLAAADEMAASAQWELLALNSQGHQVFGDTHTYVTDYEGVRDNLSADGSELVGKWGVVTDGQADVRLWIRKDGTCERYESFASEHNRIYGAWMFVFDPDEFPDCNNLLLFVNQSAVMAGEKIEQAEDAYDYVPYELLEFTGDLFTYRNLVSGNITTYQRLG